MPTLRDILASTPASGSPFVHQFSGSHPWCAEEVTLYEDIDPRVLQASAARVIDALERDPKCVKTNPLWLARGCLMAGVTILAHRVPEDPQTMLEIEPVALGELRSLIAMLAQLTGELERTTPEVIVEEEELLDPSSHPSQRPPVVSML